MLSMWFKISIAIQFQKHNKIFEPKCTNKVFSFSLPIPSYYCMHVLYYAIMYAICFTLQFQKKFMQQRTNKLQIFTFFSFYPIRKYGPFLRRFFCPLDAPTFVQRMAKGSSNPFERVRRGFSLRS